jgi:hypothetical protein
VRNEHDVRTVADRLDDDVRVDVEAGALVRGGEVEGDDVVSCTGRSGSTRCQYHDSPPAPAPGTDVRAF